jgi:hypothetical protein
MIRKLLTVILISLLFLSCFGLVLAKQVKCPTCDGVGSIECPTCQSSGVVNQGVGYKCENCSGAGTLTPRIWMRTMDAPSAHDGSTFITATFQNKEIVSVDATVTASIDGHSVTSSVTTFPPFEDITLTIEVPYISTYSGFSLMQHTTVKATNVPEITCPYCDGTGSVYASKICPDCHGAGIVTCPDCDGTGYVDESIVQQLQSGQSSGLDLMLIGGVVAAVAVVGGGGFAGFLLLKKRRVSEKSLRRLSAAEFQAWVIKRLEGKTSASMDVSMGIDGYTSLNQPIQIRQSDGLGMNAVDLFASSVARKRAAGGVLVAFSFADDAIRGKVRARRSLNLDIQMMTVAELIEKRRPY